VKSEVNYYAGVEAIGGIFACEFWGALENAKAVSKQKAERIVTGENKRAKRTFYFDVSRWRCVPAD